MNWRTRLAVWLLRGLVIDGDPSKGYPIVFADPQVVDFDTLGPDFPLTMVYARPRPGHPLSDSFFVVRLPEEKRA